MYAITRFVNTRSQTGGLRRNTDTHTEVLSSMDTRTTTVLGPGQRWSGEVVDAHSKIKGPAHHIEWSKKVVYFFVRLITRFIIILCGATLSKTYYYVETHDL